MSNGAPFSTFFQWNLLNLSFPPSFFIGSAIHTRSYLGRCPFLLFGILNAVPLSDSLPLLPHIALIFRYLVSRFSLCPTSLLPFPPSFLMPPRRKATVVDPDVPKKGSGANPSGVVKPIRSSRKLYVFYNMSVL